MNFENEEARLRHPLASKIPKDLYDLHFRNGIDDSQLAIMQSADDITAITKLTQSLSEKEKFAAWICYTFGHENIEDSKKIQILNDLSLSSMGKFNLLFQREAWLKEFIIQNKENFLKDPSLELQMVISMAVLRPYSDVIKTIKGIAPETLSKVLQSQSFLSQLSSMQVNQDKNEIHFILKVEPKLFKNVKQDGMIDTIVDDWLKTLKDKKNKYDPTLANALFDIEDHDEIAFGYGALSYLIRRNNPRDSDNMRLLLDMPSLREYIGSENTELKEIATKADNTDAERLLKKLERESLNLTRLHPSVPRKIIKLIKVEDTESKITLPGTLPESYVDLREYMEKHGDGYRAIVKGLALRLESWASRNGLEVGWVDDFMKKMQPNELATPYQQIAMHPFITQGVFSLEQLLFILEDKDKCPQNAKDIVKDVIDFIKLCGPGVHTRLALARYQLVSDVDVELRENRRTIVNNVVAMIAHEIERENPDMYISAGMEVHYGNTVANYFHEDLAFVEMDDIHAEHSSNAEANEVLDLFILKFPEHFFASYTASGIVDKLADGIDIDFSDKGKTVDWFWSRMNVYGPDPGFVIQDLYDEDDTTFKTLAKNAQDLLRITIFNRLKNSGVLNNVVHEVKAGKNTVSWYPYDRSLSYVVSMGVREPFNDYMKKLIDAKDMTKLNALHAAIIPTFKTFDQLTSYVQIFPPDMVHVSVENLNEVLQKELANLANKGIQFIFYEDHALTNKVLRILDKRILSGLHDADTYKQFYNTLLIENKRNYLFYLKKIGVNPYESLLGRINRFPISQDELSDLTKEPEALTKLREYLNAFGEDPLFNDPAILLDHKGNPFDPESLRAQIEISFQQRCIQSGLAKDNYKEVELDQVKIHLHPNEASWSWVEIDGKRRLFLDYCEEQLSKGNLTVMKLVKENYFDQIQDRAALDLFLSRMPAIVLDNMQAQIIELFNQRPELFDLNSIVTMPVAVQKVMIDMFDADRLRLMINVSNATLKKNFRDFWYKELAKGMPEPEKEMLIRLVRKVDPDYASLDSLLNMLEFFQDNNNRNKPFIAVLDSLGLDPFYDPEKPEILQKLITLWVRLQQGDETEKQIEMKNGNDTVFINKDDLALSYVIVDGKRQLLEDYYKDNLELQQRIINEVDFSKSLKGEGSLPIFLRLMPANKILTYMTKDELMDISKTIRKLMRDKIDSVNRDLFPTMLYTLNKTDTNLTKLLVIRKDGFHNLATYMTEQGYCDVLSELKKYSVDFNQANGEGKIPLEYALGHTINDTLKTLLDENTAINVNKSFDEESGCTAAHELVLRADFTGDFKERLEILLKAGLDLNVHSTLHEYPIMIAIANGKASVFKLLVENGADLSKKSSTGETAIDYLERVVQEKSAAGSGYDVEEYEKMRGFVASHIIRNNLTAMSATEWKALEENQYRGLVQDGTADISFMVAVANTEEKRQELPRLFGVDACNDLLDAFFEDANTEKESIFKQFKSEDYQTFFDLIQKLDKSNEDRFENLCIHFVKNANIEALKELRAFGFNIAAVKTDLPGIARRSFDLDTLKVLTDVGVDLFANFRDSPRIEFEEIKVKNGDEIYEYMKGRFDIIQRNQQALIEQFDEEDSKDWKSAINVDYVKSLIDDHQLGAPFLRSLAQSAGNMKALVDVIGAEYSKKLVEFIDGNDKGKAHAKEVNSFKALISKVQMPHSHTTLFATNKSSPTTTPANAIKKEGP